MLWFFIPPVTSSKGYCVNKQLAPLSYFACSGAGLQKTEAANCLFKRNQRSSIAGTGNAFFSEMFILILFIPQLRFMYLGEVEISYEDVAAFLQVEKHTQNKNHFNSFTYFCPRLEWTLE